MNTELQTIELDLASQAKETILSSFIKNLSAYKLLIQELQEITEKIDFKFKSPSFGCTVVIANEIYLLTKNHNGFFIQRCHFDDEGKELESSIYEKRNHSINGNPLKSIDSFLRKERGHLLDEKGCVYLITDGEFIKIGATSYNTKKRLNELQVGNRLRLSMVGEYKVSNKISTEKMLHEKYGDKRVLGEWFKLSSSDVNAILTEKKQVIHNSIYSVLSDNDILNINRVIRILNTDTYQWKKKIFSRKERCIKAINYEMAVIEKRMCFLQNKGLSKQSTMLNPPLNAIERVISNQTNLALN